MWIISSTYCSFVDKIIIKAQLNKTGGWEIPARHYEEFGYHFWRTFVRA